MPILSATVSFRWLLPFRSRKQRREQDRSYRLCKPCKDVFDRLYLYNPEDGIRRSQPHHSLNDLFASAHKGCPTCVLFAAALEEHEDKVDQVSAVARRRPSVSSYWNPNKLVGGCKVILNFGKDTLVDPVGFPLTAIRVVDASLLSDPLITTARVNAPTTDCEATWAQVKQWLKWCASGSIQADTNESGSGSNSELGYFVCHKPCAEQVRSKMLPARLIRVPPDNTVNIQLCHTRDLSKDITDNLKYVTLSHCWGKGQMSLITTQDNLNQHLARIPFSRLSKTFQHAVIITQRLGFGYLWIDSLCIIQGDEADWTKQSFWMGHTYSNSTLNIIASAAADGSVGCFFDRDTAKLHGYKVKARAAQDSTDLSPWNCMSTDLGYSETAESATAKRAWCFQESFLAPRNLHFAESQLFWECRQFSACEAFPLGMDRRLTTASQVLGNWGTKYTPNYFCQWFDLVGEYSARSLTYSKDKLIAVAGVAELFAFKFGLKRRGPRGRGQWYLAGMWQKYLEYQLVWLVPEGRVRPRNRELKSPSWSWASNDGNVFLAGNEIHIPDAELSIVSAETMLCSDNEYGDVRGGTLKIQCRGLIAVEVTAKSELRIRRHGGHTISKSFVYPDTEPHGFNEDYTFIFALPCWTLWDGSRWGLLLKSPGGLAGLGIFSRVGVYKLDSEDLSAAEIEGAASLLAASTSTVPAGGEPGVLGCIITII